MPGYKGRAEMERKMRSDSVKTGTQQAPHRSLFNALGYTEEERKRPMIGIVMRLYRGI